MTQLWALTVDSGWLPGGPVLREGGGTGKTRWDVITPCNLKEIHWAAHSQDESTPRVPSLHSPPSPTACKKPKKRGSEKQFCLVGVPQGLVLGPSQISYSPGAMFFPQGVAPQTDSQTARPVLYGPGAASQPAYNSPEILLSGKGAQWSLCWGLCLYLAVCLSFCLTPSYVTLSSLTSLRHLNLRRRGDVF